MQGIFKRSATRVLGRVMTWTSRKYIVSKAETPADFDDIAAFNYQIFSKEIRQHPENASGLLIDAYHNANTYFICRFRSKIIGMVCLTDPKISGFSVAKKVKDPHIFDPYLTNSLEVRLLAVEKKHRGSKVFWKLTQALADYTLAAQVEQVFISGISEREGMYRKLGFESIAPAATSGEASFIPMKLTRERFLALKPALGLL